MLKGHVRLGLETDAGAEDVGKGGTLLGKGVDNGSAGGSEGSLEHVGEDAQDAVEVLEVLLGSGASLGSLPLDAGHHLGDDDEIDDQGGGEQRILAHVEERDGLVTAAEDLGVVLVEGALVIADGRHVLDHDGVVGVLALLVENRVGGDHVVDDVGLGNLLGAELLLGRQVVAVVVAQVVVGRDRGQLDAGVDEEVGQGGLHLGLAGLEVVAADEGTVALGKLDGAGHEGVLGRAVDEGSALKDASNGEDGGGGDLLMAGLDGLEEVVGGVVDAVNQVGVTLGVGSPEDNDLVEAVVGLELANVLADLLNVLHAGLGAGENVVGTVLLVGSNEVGVVDGGEGSHLGHLLTDKLLHGRLEDLGAIHGLVEGQAGDVPAANDEVVGVDHGKDVVEGNVDVLALGVDAELDGGTHDDGAVVVGLLGALLGGPAVLVLVGEDAGSDGGTVVAAPADQHHTGLGDLSVDLEVVEGLLGDGDIAIALEGAQGGAVGVFGANLLVGVDYVGGVDNESLGGGVDVSITVGMSAVGAVGTVDRRHVDGSKGGCSGAGKWLVGYLG